MIARTGSDAEVAREAARHKNGQFGEQHRNEATVDVGTITTFPGPDVGAVADARLFVAVHPLLEDFDGEGELPVMYDEGKTFVDVNTYGDEYPPKWELVDADVSEWLTRDGSMLDLGRLGRHFHEVDDDESVSEMYELAEHDHGDDVVYSGGDDEPVFEYGLVEADQDVSAVLPEESPVDAAGALTEVATRKTRIPVTVDGVEYRVVITDAAWVEATTGGAAFGREEHNTAQLEDQGYPDEVDRSVPVEGVEYQVAQGRLIEVFDADGVSVGSDVSWDASVSGCDNPADGEGEAREAVLAEVHAADDFGFEVEMILDRVGR